MSITTDESHAAGRSLEVAQVIRDGGGIAPVELTVAAKLRDRGHRVTLYGPPEVREHTHAAGFDLEPLDWPRQLAPRFGDADLVVADCTVFGALMAARLPRDRVRPDPRAGRTAQGHHDGMTGTCELSPALRR